MAVGSSWSPLSIADSETKNGIEFSSEFEERCISVSIIERIQLSRKPERREAMQFDCMPEKWMTRYFMEVNDANYFNSKESDTAFRAGLSSAEEQPFYVSRDANFSLGAAATFQTMSSPNSKEIDQPLQLETAEKHTTLYPNTKDRKE